jgi:excinuclease UvrABC nuclease subunit
MKKKIFEELSRDYQKICRGNAKKITNELIESLPPKPGVYIFYSKIKKKVKYVGRANNLKKRIKSHLSKSKKSSSSSFRRKISMKKKKVVYEKTKQYMEKNLLLYYLEFDKKYPYVYDYTLLLEAFLIRQWRSMKKHNKLLNCYINLRYKNGEK